MITSAILLAIPALAAAEDVAKLDVINVYSASATPTSLHQTASSVTVLTEKDFAQRGATYVSDVLKTVPSLAVSTSGGRGTLTNVFLRGADANHTAVIIDGVKVNPVSGYGFDFGGLALSNIDRIEVLRGEQSALWGSDAMGGVIYITTKKGLEKGKTFNIDYDFGTGSNRTVDGSLTLSGSNNHFYYALHGDSHHTKGISALSKNHFNYTAQDGTAVSTGGSSERDKFHRDNASLRIGYDDNQKGFDFLTSHSSQTAHFDNSATDEKGHYTRTRDTLFKLSGFLGNDDELLKHKVGVSHLKTDSDTVGYTSAYDAKKLNANYQLDVNFDREGTLTQGLSFLTDYQKTDFNSSYFNNAGNKKLVEKSLAAEYRLLHDADHSLNISGRYTDSSEYENSWTGRIAGAYRLHNNVKAHASFGSAIQNPTITEYYGYNARYIGNPNLQPEKSLGGDIGLLFETNDGRHSFDVTYFARNVKNAISSEVINFTTYASRAVNLEGKSKVKGVEVAYNGKITDALTAYANYTYTQTRDSKGAELARRPKHLANAGLAYQITEKWGADVNVSYTGKRMDTYYSPTYSTHKVKLPSYTLANLGVNYKVADSLTIYANLNNVFNKKYENVLGYGQEGCNVYVGLKGSF